MATTSRYDAHAEWYDEFLRTDAAGYTAAVSSELAALLGPGPGRCVDVGSGTGAQAETIRALGWQLVGVEPSAGQAAIGRDRMRVVRGDGARLPLADASVEAVVAVLIHTDVDDWDAVVAEAARVLVPGGRFAYVGVHPCFVSPYAIAGADSVVLVPGYDDPSLVFSSPAFLHGATGLRARVGVRHRTLTDLLGALPRAGLSLAEIREDGGSIVPGRLGLAAVRPG